MAPPRLAALAAALMIGLTSALAGCVTEGPGVTNRTNLQPGEEQYWTAPGRAHPAAGAIAGDALTLEGVLFPRVDNHDVTFVPPLVTGDAGAFASGGLAPKKLILEDAVLDGEHGTLVMDFADGVRIQSPVDLVPVLPASIHATAAGGTRARIPGIQDAYHVSNPAVEACETQPSDPSCETAAAHAVAPIPRALRAGLSTLRFGFTSPVTVTADNLTFVDVRGDARPLGASATIDRAKALWFTSEALSGAAVDVRLADDVEVAWLGNLTVVAEGAGGSLEVAGKDRAIPAGTLATGWRGTEPTPFGGAGGTIAIRSEAGRFTVSGLDGDLVDARTNGVPRLPATLAVLPQIIDVEGEPGETARFKVILLERSGGAHAHLAKHRAEGADIRYVAIEPFAITNSLLDLADEAIAAAEANAMAAFITVPAVLAIGITVPFVALAEAFVGIFNAIFPPSLAGTVVEAGTADVATFAVRIPENETTATLVIPGSNVEERTVIVRLHPMSG